VRTRKSLLKRLLSIIGLLALIALLSTSMTSASATPVSVRDQLAAPAVVVKAPAIPQAKAPAPAASPAPSTDVWTRLAQCSSNGNWTVHRGNGYSGGLAIKASTWALFGGSQYAPQAYQATQAQQISVGEKIAAGQGWQAWPKCAVQFGFTGATAPQAAPAPAAPKTPPAPKKQTKSGAAVPSAHAAITGTGVTVTLPNGTSVTAPNAKAATAVRAALSQLGVPYRYGANRPGAVLDCSALTQYAYRQAGVALGRTSGSQTVGAKITANNLMAGDLAVWDGHVAMALGNGQMLETGATVVKIVPLRRSNIGMHFLGFYRPTA
jgi:cell wall-associated NlpC family hydrolase